MHAVLVRFPRKVERIDRYAMPPESRARVIRHETEGLGRSRADHLEYIDAHPVGDDLHLVHQSDVDGTVNVLQQLDEFGGASGAHRYDDVDDCPVNRFADGKTLGRHAAHDLWNRASRIPLVTRVLAFG